MRAEERVEHHRARSADGPLPPVDLRDRGIGQHPPEPPSLEDQAAVAQGVSRRREALRRPERAQKWQGQDEEERITARRDQQDAQDEGHAEAEADSAEAADPALARPENGVERLLVHAAVASATGRPIMTA